MKVFVTGASGYIGTAVTKELINSKHQVRGLTRSEDGAKSLTALGAEPVNGTIQDVELLKREAAASDGVIHLAFGHDFSKFEQSCAEDRAAISAFGETLAGSDRPLVVTLGTLMLPHNQVSTEDDEPQKEGMAGMRGTSETVALSFASKGVRVSSIRLPPTNHGEGDFGFVPRLMDIARANGESAYIGDGTNRWPAIARIDTARLYVLALEKAKAGSKLNAVAEQGVPTKEIATAISKRLNVPVVGKKLEDAQEPFGFLAWFYSMDSPASSAKTQEQLGWKPLEPSLIADLEAGVYDNAKSKFTP